VRGLYPSAPARRGWVFFLLGAGFMVETKAITELGLSFGNTWQVVGRPPLDSRGAPAAP
jgi:hypothetical protein